MVKYDNSKLLGKIKEKVGTQKNFSQQMHINNTTMTYKLTNKSSFTRDEISRAIELLQLNKDDVYDIFFRKVVN